MKASTASHGVKETQRLQQHIAQQRDRLTQQLLDLETLETIPGGEEGFSKAERQTITTSSRAELEIWTQNTDLSLMNDRGNEKVAMEEAIREAFSTPEIIRLFQKREPDLLRAELRRPSITHEQQMEIVRALDTLEEEVGRSAVFDRDSRSCTNMSIIAHRGRKVFFGTTNETPPARISALDIDIGTKTNFKITIGEKCVYGLACA